MSLLPSPKIPVGVLISGRGSNLQALLDACAEPDYPARIVLVISNKADAYGLQRAEAAGVPSIVISHKDYPDRPQFDAAMTAALEQAGVKLVCLAGFMRILSEGFVTRWENRLINIHPSLLPKFKGTETHRRALEAGETEHGCTVHWVTAELDSGPIILQKPVPVLANDTEDSLAERVLAQEHGCYVSALKIAAESLT